MAAAGAGAAVAELAAVAFGFGAVRAARGFADGADVGAAAVAFVGTATGAGVVGAVPTVGRAERLTVVTAGVVGIGVGAATGEGAAAAVTAGGGGAATWTDSFAPRRDQRLRPKASAAAAQQTVAKVFQGLRSARATSCAPSAGGGPKYAGGGGVAGSGAM